MLVCGQYNRPSCMGVLVSGALNRVSCLAAWRMPCLCSMPLKQTDLHHWCARLGIPSETPNVDPACDGNGRIAVLS